MSPRPPLLSRLKAWAKSIRRDILTLWIAAHDPRTPLAARLLCAAIAAYALSPIDLIPDAIPVLGLLDEAILLPLLMLLAMRLIPPPLLAAFREEAARRAERPTSRAGALAVISLWLFAVLIVARLVWPAE